MALKQKKDAIFSFEPQWFVVIVFFCAGIFLGALGVFTWITQTGGPRVVKKIHPSTSQYTFVNPLLGIEVSKKQEYLEDKTIKRTLQHALETDKQNGLLSDYAVYFRELETGLWTGIQEDQKMTVPSYFSLPLMIAYFKEAKDQPDLLNKTVKQLKEERAVQPLEKTQSSETPLDAQSLEEVIQKMMSENDTPTAKTLSELLPQDKLSAIYKDLGLTLSEDGKTILSLKTYAFLYRLLYNATYLNGEYSEKALSALHAESNDLDAQLPKSILTTHSSGDFQVQNSQLVEYESHDCGIVYFPEHPYILCMKLTSANHDNAHTVFQEISSIIYNTLTSKYHLSNN